MKRHLILPGRLIPAFSLFLSVFPALAGIPYPDALDAAAVKQTTLSDLNRNAMLVGNGDLSGLFYERHGALCLRISKNDIWDARVDTSQDPPMVRVDVPNHKWTGGGHNPSYDRPYPTPRTAAIVNIGKPRASAWDCIRAEGKRNEWTNGVMAIAGTTGASAGYQASVPVASRFHRVEFKISGSANARYYVTIHSNAGAKESGWRDSPTTEETVAFEGKDITAVLIYIWTKDGALTENRIRDLKLTGDASSLTLPAGMPTGRTTAAKLDLRRAVATAGGTTVRALSDRHVFLIETDQEVALEEIKAGYLPAAELGEAGGVKWLHMKMPGDLDYAGMEYAVAVAGEGSRKAVALVASWDTKTSVREAATQLARTTAASEPAPLIARHEADWATFWSASGVALSDPEFQHWWYRMVYWLRCSSRPGAMPIGLFTPSSSDAPPWHGDYHHNYNAWQPFWTAFNINHPELAEPWVRYMNDMLPRLEWFARTTYDCEGAFVGISSFAFEPDPAQCRSKHNRQVAMMPWGYTLGMMGMSSQVLWYHHLYQPDRKVLAARLYPVVRATALFYCSFAEKCQRDATGKARFGPSYSPEHGGFGVDNVPFDLAYARTSLQAAIGAAEELGQDRELTSRFRKALDLLPDYPTAPDKDGNPVVVDWTGCKFREIGEHNITVPAVPVFPADQVTWFSAESEKKLFLNTLRQTRHRGLNATIMLSVAKARLSMPEACDDLRNYYKPLEQPNGLFFVPGCGYYLVETVGIAAGIGEFLLQSVDNTIRVFPCWPKDKDARFTDLRAQGGFLVTAEQKGGKVTKLEITSTVGGPLRLLDPWSGKMTQQQTQPGKKLLFTEGAAAPAASPNVRAPGVEAGTVTGTASAGLSMLKPETFRHYVDAFNRNDHELVTNHIPNAAAWDWMANNVPLLDCPDKDLEEIYYFRWWTYRKHIKQTPDGFVVTEYLPQVSWSKKYNTINCPAGHHLYEGRWIHNPKYLDGYARFYFGKGGDPGGVTKVYSNWLTDGLHARYLVNADKALVTGLLDELVKNHEAWSRDGRTGDPWQKSRRLENGLFWQIDSWEGGEYSIGGTGIRPMINSYRYGDAAAIARIAELAGRKELADQYRAEADQLRKRVQDQLWDPDAKFFKVLRHEKVPTNQYVNSAAESCMPGKRVNVREIFGYVPWYFNLPEDGRGYEEAWRQLIDPQGFLAPYGPTVAERRHPSFKINSAGCEWCGASWPFSTAQTLTALANLLNNYRQSVLGKRDYFDTLKAYTRSHRLKVKDGVVVPWIDESLNPDTGAWIRNGDRGANYNHSTYCDLVISGLVGLRPRADDTIEVNPLVPEGTWDYFCLDQVLYHGRIITIFYDKTGQRYGQGKGLQVLADGRRVAGSQSLQRVTGRLP